jgi:hypothetical protein
MSSGCRCGPETINSVTINTRSVDLARGDLEFHVDTDSLERDVLFQRGILLLVRHVSRFQFNEVLTLRRLFKPATNLLLFERGFIDDVTQSVVAKSDSPEVVSSAWSRST